MVKLIRNTEKMMGSYTEEERKKGIWNSLGIPKERCPICNELEDDSPPEVNIHAPCCIILDKQREEAKKKLIDENQNELPFSILYKGHTHGYRR